MRRPAVLGLMYVDKAETQSFRMRSMSISLVLSEAEAYRPDDILVTMA
jgi:hypothetical protein